mmetsp:Transcript_20714/g.42287  ORF Transcript_20714/g.42287 Transcript_20714/m.42287 type:complete len:210 (-) Transcript_20714:1228-1857(-)
MVKSAMARRPRLRIQSQPPQPPRRRRAVPPCSKRFSVRRSSLLRPNVKPMSSCQVASSSLLPLRLCMVTSGRSSEMPLLQPSVPARSTFLLQPMLQHAVSTSRMSISLFSSSPLVIPIPTSIAPVGPAAQDRREHLSFSLILDRRGTLFRLSAILGMASSLTSRVLRPLRLRFTPSPLLQPLPLKVSPTMLQSTSMKQHNLFSTMLKTR